MRRLLLLLLALPAAGGDAPNLAKVMPPAGEVGVTVAIESAVRFLVAGQNRDGSFGTRTSGRDYEVSADVPGGHQAFQAATTALCWMGLAAVKFQPPESVEAQSRALSWLVRNVRVKRANEGEMYNIWSFGYGLQAIARALRAKAKGATEEALRAVAADLVKALGLYQTPDGGWGYYEFQYHTFQPTWSTSFSTATILIGLYEAREAGIAVPDSMVERACKNVLRCKKEDGSYLYGTYMQYRPLHGVNQPKGSSLRTQACHLALNLFGKGVGEADLRAGLNMLEEEHRFAVAGVRRPIPHESWYAVSGYFYLYGHMYAAEVLRRMPEADRARFWPFVIEAILKTRQPDGSFWDYPLYGYHKFYGTGYALMAFALAPQ